MKAKAKHIEVNNIETRLKDCKTSYDFNQKLIDRLLDNISKEDLVVKNGNNTESASPSMRMYMDILKSQMQLRKQINDMEILIEDGKGAREEETNPFA